MSFLKLPKDAKFSNKTILAFMLPILLEQLLISSLSIVDTFMIAKLPDSEAALAGIANVSRLDTLIKQIFIALAAGGSIFVAQYIGAKRYEKANKVLKLSVFSMFIVAVIMTVFMEIFKTQILNFLFGDVEAEVMAQSIKYYTVTIIAYPFMAIFNAGTASFRAMRKSKITLFASTIMMLLNIGLKYIFLFHFNLGVVGAGISLLIAYLITGIGLLFMLSNRKNDAFIDNILMPEWDLKLLGKIYKVALPTGIENGMFQLGALILQSLVASLGTVAINANHLTNSITSIIYAPASAFTLGIIPFVSQCMGADEDDEAEFYVKHILKLDHISLFIVFVLAIPLLPIIIAAFGMSEEISRQTLYISLIYYICTPIFYPRSFALPNAMRGAGDTRFPMLTSIATMFLFRIGLAYLFTKVFSMGIVSIWIAMVCDWVVRGVIFSIRFKMGVWKNKHLIDTN